MSLAKGNQGRFAGESSNRVVSTSKSPMTGFLSSFGQNATGWPFKPTMNGSSSYGMSSPVLASLAVFWYAGNPRSEPRRNLPGSPSSPILTSHVALDHDGSSAAAAAGLFAGPADLAAN